MTPLAKSVRRRVEIVVIGASTGGPAALSRLLPAFAPGGYHVTLARSGCSLELRLNQDPPENSCRPSADVLFRSAAETSDAGTLAVALTGMGHDKLQGARRVAQAGGQILVQDEESSVIWGMPGHVAEAGLADIDQAHSF